MADPLTPAGKNRVRDLRKSLKLQIWKCPKTNEWENSKKNMIQNKGWSLKTMISKVGISCFGCRRSSAGSIFVGVCMSQFSKVAAQLRSFGSWSLFLWGKRTQQTGRTRYPHFFLENIQMFTTILYCWATIWPINSIFHIDSQWNDRRSFHLKFPKDFRWRFVERRKTHRGLADSFCKWEYMTQLPKVVLAWLSYHSLFSRYYVYLYIQYIWYLYNYVR